MRKLDGLFKRIRKIVAKIPRGKVATYGQIARLVGSRDARKVGWALWGNPESGIACHRVVRADGTLAPKFSLGGWPEQKKKLVSEGIKFKKPRQVDLAECLWQK